MRKAGIVSLLNLLPIKLPNDVGVTPCWIRFAEWVVMLLHLRKPVSEVCLSSVPLSAYTNKIPGSNRTGYIPGTARLGST